MNPKPIQNRSGSGQAGLAAVAKSILPRLLQLVVAACLIFSFSVQAASKKKGAPKDPGIRGEITAVTADSLTVSGKAIQVDDTTTISLDGRSVKLKDVKKGMFAQVNTFTLGDRLTAVSVRASIKPLADAGPEKKKKKK